MTFSVVNELDRFKSALVLVAHPDDAEARAGGLIARLTAQATSVQVIVCTDGSKGIRKWFPDGNGLVAQRQREQLSASNRLGVEKTHFLGYIDGELENTRDLKRALVRHIRTFRPQLVITHDPWALYQLHPDHRATGFAACDAVMAASGPGYFTELFAESLAPHGVSQLFLMASTAPNIFVNIEDTITQKLEALACHVSQGDHRPEVQQRVSNRDRQAGQMVQLGYAEPFRRLVLADFLENPLETDASEAGAPVKARPAEWLAEAPGKLAEVER